MANPQRNGVGVSNSQNCDASVAAALAPYKNPATVQQKMVDKNKSEYYTSTENSNALPNEVLSLESSYFLSKYNKAIYKGLLDIRANYITPPSDTTGFPLNEYNKALESIYVLNQAQTIDSPLYTLLEKYLPGYDANTLYREIEYRDTEYAKLIKINYYLNIFYYCLFIILILTLFSSDKLFLRDRFVIYIFLAILPILYPWIFLLFRRIYLYFNPSIQYNGPENAFIDTNTSVITSFSNNVNNSYKKKEDAAV